MDKMLDYIIYRKVYIMLANLKNWHAIHAVCK